MYLTAVIQTIILDHNSIRMKIETDEQMWEQKVNLSCSLCAMVHVKAAAFIIAPDAKIDDGIIALCHDQRC